MHTTEGKKSQPVMSPACYKSWHDQDMPTGAILERILWR